MSFTRRGAAAAASEVALFCGHWSNYIFYIVKQRKRCPLIIETLEVSEAHTYSGRKLPVSGSGGWVASNNEPSHLIRRVINSNDSLQWTSCSWLVVGNIFGGKLRTKGRNQWRQNMMKIFRVLEREQKRFFLFIRTLQRSSNEWTRENKVHRIGQIKVIEMDS